MSGVEVLTICDGQIGATLLTVPPMVQHGMMQQHDIMPITRIVRAGLPAWATLRQGKALLLASSLRTAVDVRRDKAAFSSGCIAPRQQLQPEATGAAMEVTKWLKPSHSGSRLGDRAGVQAAT